MSLQTAILVATDTRLLRRSCESLLGIAAGLIADGDLNDKEIQFLSTWLAEHREMGSTWPGEIVLRRVSQALADGVITVEERDYLKTTLGQLIGGEFADDGAIPAMSSGLPVEADAIVRVSEASFCFTGQFLFGTRAACERAVLQRGGQIVSVSKKLDYLVIGELSSRDWKYSAFGGKIESAMKLKSEGHALRVVGEAQWVAAL